MIKKSVFIAVFMVFFGGFSQEVSLPADLRQHALTQYNASLFNPAFALDRNNAPSMSLWTRWQWQQIDADPTTLFLNYSANLGANSSGGAGFFQHNTGVYFNTGGVANYAFAVEFNPLIKLSFGANLFGFNQSLADIRFVPDPDALPFPVDITDDFILQLAPGMNFTVENFSLGLASENLLDYNFNDKAANTAKADKIFMGMASYDFPVRSKDSTAYIRPSVYLRTIPEEQNQIGVNALFSARNYWLQSGYNNFYGISAGVGGTLFNRLSIGALMEFGLGSSLNTKDPSFEIIASYYLGNPIDRRKPIVNVLDELGQENVITDTKASTEKESDTATGKQQQAEAVEEKRTTVQDNDTKIDIAVAAQKQKERSKDSLDLLKKEQAALEKAAKASDKKAKEAATEARKEAAKMDAEKQEAILLQQRKQAADLERKNAEKLKQETEENAKRALAAETLKLKQQQDSIVAAQVVPQNHEKSKAENNPEPAEKIVLESGEKYEEVAAESGLEPGFYLIANVFGTQKYYEAFMQMLRKKGLEPSSFVRSKNKYNYVYLKRYSTISEARKARDSNLNGKYQDKTWIFRVVGK